MWLLSLKHLILRAFQVYKIPIVNGMVWWYASLKPAVGHRNNIVIVNRGNGNLTEIQLQTFQADFCLIRCGHYGSTRTKMFTSNHYFEYLSPKTSDTRQLLVIFHFMTTFHKFVIVFLIPMQICWYTGSAWTCHTAVILSILKPKQIHFCPLQVRHLHYLFLVTIQYYSLDWPTALNERNQNGCSGF